MSTFSTLLYLHCFTDPSSQTFENMGQFRLYFPFFQEVS